MVPVEATWPEGADAPPETLAAPGRIEVHGGDVVAMMTIVQLDPTPTGAMVRIRASSLAGGEVAAAITHRGLGALATDLRRRLPTRADPAWSKSGYVVRISLPVEGDPITRTFHEVGPWPGVPPEPGVEYVGVAIMPLVGIVGTLASAIERRAAVATRRAMPEPPPVPRPDFTLVIDVVVGGGLPRRHRVESMECSIGRAKDSDIPIADSKISRRHARITWSRDHFEIEDRISTEGVLFEGHRIDRRTIADGDRYQLGPALLICRFEQHS